MNYVELKGGLGNQIFQYVLAKYIQNITGRCSVIHTDFFDYAKRIPGVTLRELELDKFNTEYISVSGRIVCNGAIQEEELKSGGALIKPGCIFYRGYWQDKKYLEPVRERVLRELTLKDEYISDSMREYAKKMKEGESLSLHIRGTDYLQGQNRNIFAGQDADYYKAALKYIKGKRGGDQKVFVFTDDPAYAESILTGIGDVTYEIMPVNKAYQDLWLMSRCRHHIIANSSYSYWGAMIGDNAKDGGVTVAPKKWFIQMQAPDLYPDHWIVL